MTTEYVVYIFTATSEELGSTERGLIGASTQVEAVQALNVRGLSGVEVEPATQDALADLLYQQYDLEMAILASL